MNTVTQGSNVFCGPAVLSILTGKSTDYTASMLSRVSRRSNIKSVTVAELNSCIDLLGFKSTKIDILEDATLFYTFHHLYDKPGLYMVILPKHVIAVEVTDSQQVLVCDNHTKEPMNASAFSRLGQRCNQVFKIEVKPVVIEVSSRLEVKASTSTPKYLSVYRVTEWSDGKVDNHFLSSFQFRNDSEYQEFKSQLP